MTDSDLDSVAAGLSLSDLGKLLSSLSTQQILSHPEYEGQSAGAVSQYNALPDTHKAEVAKQVLAGFPLLTPAEQTKLRAITPGALQHLLPKAPY
jgi:hypothetical protein